MNINARDLEEIIRIINSRSSDNYFEFEILDEKLDETIHLLKEVNSMLSQLFATQPPADLLEEIDYPELPEY